ncbi:ABC transporter permease/substrate binding protein [Paenactinomyces guangxiensis]|uniref:ABC transporter permease/substrate binding protein n=1 Tax=Paenactinomyces guangxiensis TaxID=1490290 RepID=A0A7W1WSI0_9BACL|nr:ABC transporter permease/substrate binding protein [Paenactinomyces guangxiensis]MBA4495263.1 ABC transporter permease/substrate binding protein [Paenactinomyces guangxiensis]MBH8592347.1 ABC transporter permease/substrate binding protein [Paenactinomyces guangxiensis]
MNIEKLPLADWIDALIEWMQIYFKPLFSVISGTIEPTVDYFQRLLTLLPPIGTIVLITLLTWWITRFRVALFSLAGLLLIYNLGYWEESVETIALVLTSTIISIVIGIPFGLWTGRSQRVQQGVNPLLDFMQTMPSFVYLIPAVFFFSLGTVPGVIASVIFSMPPTIRLTALGLRQVSRELKEAADAFGSTSLQKLLKVEIPLAKPTIMAGVNQTIMLSLSMVVTASMIGAGGLGSIVLESITRLKVGKGFESGLAIVIIAIILDRLTQNMGKRKENGSRKSRKWIGGMVLVAVISLITASFFQTTGVEQKKKITLTYVNWVSEEASTHVVKKVLEDQGYKVELQEVEPGPMWDGVAKGSADAMVAAWLPTASKQYYDRYKDEVVNLGPNLKGTKQGLVVPDYVTINSYEQLNAYKEKFDNKIIGIDPGTGTMLFAKNTIKQYGLDMELVEGSDAAMTAALDQAIKQKKWIVVTGWTPHWMFVKYDLKYLEDPKGTFGPEEAIYTIVRKGLKEDMPEAYQILDRFYWTAKDMEEVMVQVEEGKTPDEAAANWVAEHQDQVKQWTAGLKQNQ